MNNGLLKRSSQQFILDFGWWYEPSARSPEFSAGVPQDCFSNALKLISNGLVYCEGFVIAKSGVPTLHGWVTDGTGIAIDNTLPVPGLAYAGVPFASLFVLNQAVQYKAVVPLLDDWEHNWPLLGELSNRPVEWSESEGNGFRKISAAL
jgi:hypothetical protein